MLSDSPTVGNVSAASISRRPSSPAYSGALGERIGSSDPDGKTVRHERDRPVGGHDRATGPLHDLSLLWAIMVFGVPLLLYCILVVPK